MLKRKNRKFCETGDRHRERSMIARTAKINVFYREESEVTICCIKYTLVKKSGCVL